VTFIAFYGTNVTLRSVGWQAGSGQTVTITTEFAYTIFFGTYHPGDYTATMEIKQGEPYRLVGGHVDYTFGSAGDVTFTMGLVRQPILLCGANNPSPVITTTHVS
jgi:hypothetical protein